MTKPAFMLLTIATLALTGCAFSDIKAPQARVESVRLTEQSDKGARVEVALIMTNPNDKALALKRTDYSVRLSQGGVFRFKDESNRTLPANGEQTILLPAAFATDGNINAAQYEVRGDVSYEPPGQLRRSLTESGIPLPSVSFSKSGSLE